MVLAYLQLLGATKNKDCSLENYKGLRGRQELRLDWLMRFVFYMKPVCPDWERWLLYLMCRNNTGNQRKRRNEGICSKQKNKINLQKLILMKY